MVKSRRRFFVFLTAALFAVAAPLLIVMACGPDFEPEVFTPATHPEDRKVYAVGRLGILQPGYWQADKIVAYRYLIGGRLSSAEQAVYNPPAPSVSNLDWQAQRQAQEEQAPANRWVVARAEFVRQALAAKPSSERTIQINRQGSVERETELNCTDSAFETAIVTLHARAKTWGSESADLKDWITGQDAVFSNCSQPGTQPQPAPASATRLLRQDRAYQLAAALFYGGQYDMAVPAFESIAQDRSSPWSRWGEYLAARTEIRKAAFIAPTGDWGKQAQFDPALMSSAQARLQRVAQTGDPEIQHAALAELSFVNVRLEPEKHLNEAAKLLAGPGPDPDFSRHLDDLRFLADHGVTGNADLLEWMGLASKTDSKVDAFERWSSTHSTPWLLSALVAARPNSSEASALIAAAAKLPADSPGYATATYHRLDLILQSGQSEQARQLASTLLGTLQGDGMTGSRNAVLALRMLTAPTFAAFLEDAPRTIMASEFTSQAASDLICGTPASAGCVHQIPTTQFDEDAAEIFNQKLPLALWIEAAESHALPENLRQAVAWAAWIRAIGLKEDSIARQFEPMLPTAIRVTVSGNTGFPATLAMLRNPGLRPYLEQGVQRSASFPERDSFRDNWWCQRWGDGSNLMPDGSGRPSYGPAPLLPPKLAPIFLTPVQQDAAKNETTALNQLPYGVVWLGRRAIDYVESHPEDTDAAEALALTVRATRYGCFLPQPDDASQKAVSKKAFQLLHQRYPKSSWAAKTPYYY
jgi:hypothetical protein